MSSDRRKFKRQSLGASREGLGASGESLGPSRAGLGASREGLGASGEYQKTSELSYVSDVWKGPNVGGDFKLRTLTNTDTLGLPAGVGASWGHLSRSFFWDQF